MNKVTLTNMCMITDTKEDKILVQNRLKSWLGISFPGGHVENEESFVDSVKREVKEETGLDINNVKFCGMINWNNVESNKRYLVYLYKTESFSGELINSMEEGENFWIDKADILNIKKYKYAPFFKEYLKVFLQDEIIEIYGEHTDTDERELQFINM